MINIQLPDGNTKTYEQPVSVDEVAANIGPGLAKATLAGMVDDQLVDSHFIIDRNVTLRIITAKDPEGVDIIRHSTAHLLAQSVKQLYPDVQITIGPVIEHGFYYDIARKNGFTEEDLAKIEARMRRIVKEDLTLTRQVVSRQEAIKLFEGQGEQYKVEIIKALPEDEEITLYQQGDFIDLCRGPHVPSTRHLQAFKLTRVSGAYWRGNSNNEMLQRIYGTAWGNKKDLDAHLHLLEEAKKRDHRKLATELSLCYFDPAFPGMPAWQTKGWTLFRLIREYIQARYDEYEYQSISTPIMADQSLWEKSGHSEKFSDDMFFTESEKRLYAIKPMSCPLHVQVYKHNLHSYRELPYRLAEFGCCHRNELSGALHGLMRVRKMTQDDGHIFCTEDQIGSETHLFINQLKRVYQDFGFEVGEIRLATRPEKRVGTDKIWDKAEQTLQTILESSGLPWLLAEGEGAFYGPKLEFHLRDCIGRFWQCGTLQLDFSMPERLGAHFIAQDGTKQIPVMLHRAILGSLERFIGILIENSEGKLPLWLAPEQVVVMTITDDQTEYVKKTVDSLKNLGIRARSDLRNEKIGFKIREHTLQRIPYLVIVGASEQASTQLAIRTRAGEDMGQMSLTAFVEHIQREVSNKT